jgi:hypothetical protein
MPNLKKKKSKAEKHQIIAPAFSKQIRHASTSIKILLAQLYAPTFLLSLDAHVFIN